MYSNQNVTICCEYFQVGTPTQDRKQGDVRTPGGPGERTPSGGSGGDKASPSSKPPALISEKERRMREMERERADASLEVKKNENHQILKENLELKRQMEERQRQMGYNPNELQARQREELEKYYMYQRQRALDERRYHEQQHGRDPHAPPTKQPGKMLSPREREARERELQERERKEGDPADRRNRSASRDGRSDSAKPGERKDSDGKRSVSPGPRGTPNKDKPPSSIAGGIPPGYPPPQFYPPHGYPYHPGVAIDPGHPMYRGMNPIIGYAGPAYVHPSQIPRYHMSPSVEGAEKEKLMVSPGAGSPPTPHGPHHPAAGPEHGGGKALDLLQQHAQHASQYYGSPQAGGPPGHHKIHELSEVGRKEGAASPTGKPAERQSREREREGSPFR